MRVLPLKMASVTKAETSAPTFVCILTRSNPVVHTDSKRYDVRGCFYKGTPAFNSVLNLETIAIGST